MGREREEIMGMTTISGPVAGVRERTDVSGDRETVQTSRSIHLRIGNRPAYMKSSPNLMDGDVVTVAGKDSAEFEIMALRNESTGVIYQVMNPLFGMGAGVAVILCSLPMAILVFPPLFLIPVGIYMIWQGWQAQSAANLLRATPVHMAV
jgi:hypothetical protein